MSGGADGITDMDADYGNMDDAYNAHSQRNTDELLSYAPSPVWQQSQIPSP